MNQDKIKELIINGLAELHLRVGDHVCFNMFSAICKNGIEIKDCDKVMKELAEKGCFKKVEDTDFLHYEITKEGVSFINTYLN